MDEILDVLLSDSSVVRDLPEEDVEKTFQILKHEINHPPLQDHISGSSSNSSCCSSAFNGLEKSLVSTSVSLREKKRKADYVYRHRQMEHKKRLETHVDNLVEQNYNLKNQNDCLEREIHDTEEGLLLAKQERKKLIREIASLQCTVKSHETLLATCSQNFKSEDTQREVRDLKKKIDILSNKREDDWVIEKKELLKKVADLEHEYKLSQVQIDVLCQRLLKTDSE